MIISDPNADVEHSPHCIEIEVAWEIGHRVWHRATPDGDAGFVTGYLVREASIAYLVTWGNNRQELSHYGFELSGEPIF